MSLNDFFDKLSTKPSAQEPSAFFWLDEHVNPYDNFLKSQTHFENFLASFLGKIITLSQLKRFFDIDCKSLTDKRKTLFQTDEDLLGGTSSCLNNSIAHA